jgi:CBS domain-containing protein
MTANEVGRLPIVDENDNFKLIGLITRSDILKAYYKNTGTKF